MDGIQRLVSFYRNLDPDDRGRMLDDILVRDDDWLEDTHDYIQWLFPLVARSGANPNAPVLEPEQIEVFRNDKVLQKRLLQALDRMLAFYGLKRNGEAVVKGPNWNGRKGNWFIYPTHNNLRITRILTSLRLLGLEQEARQFFQGLLALKESEADVGVGDEAFAYWRRAVFS